ncbi:MAG: hypothetical protein ACYC5O_02970 [Anaerolineae bacterium]
MIRRAYSPGLIALLVSLALSLPQLQVQASLGSGSVPIVAAADSEPSTPTATSTRAPTVYHVPGLESSPTRVCSLSLTNTGAAVATVSVDFLNGSGVLVTSTAAVIPVGATHVLYLPDHVGYSYTGTATVSSDQPLQIDVNCVESTTTPTPTQVPGFTPASRTYVPLVRRLLGFTGPSEQEPNNSFSAANGPLISGRDYFGYPNDEKDYFSLGVRQGGPLRVQLSGHTGQQVQLQLMFGSVNNVVGAATSPPYDIQYNGAPGTYYVYIHSAGGYSTSTTYTLRVTFP